jgi:NADH-quinone oxidoreductase subunit M
MAALAEQQPLAGGGWLAHVAFFGLLIGLAVKTPLVPLHTWLPPAMPRRRPRARRSWRACS